MQPDKIIQQKEWNELNAEERSILQGLADNEQEYNLLKKMIQVSASEVFETPLIDKKVKDSLKASILPKRRSHNIYWYAAAAAVILFVAGVLFFQDSSQTDYIKKRDPITKINTPIPQTTEKTLKQDTTPLIVKTRQKPIKQGFPKTNISPDIPKDSSLADIQNTYAVHVAVKDQKELLSLVTEIY